MLKVTESSLTVEIKSSSPIEDLLQIQESIITLIQHAKADGDTNIEPALYWAGHLLKAMQLTPECIKSASILI